jgi:MoxR-like ATPase
VSPRGALFLHRASQARAATSGRDFVTPDDVKAVAMEVLAHRIRVEAGASLRGRTAVELVTRLLETVPVPVE